MVHLIRAMSPVEAAISDEQNYLKARAQIGGLASKYNLRVADMPMAIKAMDNNLDVRNAIQPRWIDVITGEYHGTREGNRSYETWHSVGSLATLKGLKKGRTKVETYGFMPIEENEWEAVGNGNYLEQDVIRVHLDDLRKGNNIPKAGTPYTIFVHLDKDTYTIGASGQLDETSFMTDDRVLMIAGSPENRDSLAKMHFGHKSKRGECYTECGSHHKIKEVSFESSRGRLVYLNNYISGFDGYGYIGNGGRFLGVSDGVVTANAEGVTQKKVTNLDTIIGESLSFSVGGIEYLKHGDIYLPQVSKE
jgi:hypothetical protein